MNECKRYARDEDRAKVVIQELHCEPAHSTALSTRNTLQVQSIESQLLALIASISPSAVSVRGVP